MTATAHWTIDHATATAHGDGVAARLTLAAPAAGLVVAGDAGAADDHLLGVDLQAEPGLPVDSWVRGGDLTAVYEPADDRGLRATAMWRPWPAPLAAWELVVSAQTSLLHADATLAVLSEFAADEPAWAAPGAGDRWTPLRSAGVLPAEAAFVLARRAATAVVVAVHPQDARRIDARPVGGRMRLACGIFPAAIEKGVILRSRVLAAVGPAAGAPRWATELCAAFAASPPFLDT